LMLAAQNILNPKDGKPVVTPSQDMVLGNHYLTMESAGAVGEGTAFKDATEALIASQNGQDHLRSRGAIAPGRLKKPTLTEEHTQKLLMTTVGKSICNEIIPDAFPYINEPTISNLEIETPDHYFLEAGADVKQAIAERDTVLPFKKGILGD